MYPYPDMGYFGYLGYVDIDDVSHGPLQRARHPATISGSLS